jgi:hypothetical protein
MAELAKTALFTYAEASKETALDNTTRIVRRITSALELPHSRSARL